MCCCDACDVCAANSETSPRHIVPVAQATAFNSSRQRDMEAISFAHYRPRKSREVLSRWRAFAVRSKKERRDGMLRVMVPRAARFFADWVAFTQRSKRNKAAVALFCGDRLGRLKSLCFKALARHRLVQQELRKEWQRKEAAAMLLHQGHGKRFAFRAWRKAVKIIKRDKRRMTYADYYANRLLVNRVFKAWRGRVRYDTRGAQRCGGVAMGPHHLVRRLVMTQAPAVAAAPAPSRQGKPPSTHAALCAARVGVWAV